MHSCSTGIQEMGKTKSSAEEKSELLLYLHKRLVPHERGDQISENNNEPTDLQHKVSPSECVIPRHLNK